MYDDINGNPHWKDDIKITRFNKTLQGECLGDLPLVEVKDKESGIIKYYRKTGQNYRDWKQGRATELFSTHALTYLSSLVAFTDRNPIIGLEAARY